LGLLLMLIVVGVAIGLVLRFRQRDQSRLRRTSNAGETGGLSASLGDRGGAAAFGEKKSYRDRRHNKEEAQNSGTGSDTEKSSQASSHKPTHAEASERKTYRDRFQATAGEDKPAGPAPTTSGSGGYRDRYRASKVQEHLPDEVIPAQDAPQETDKSGQSSPEVTRTRPGARKSHGVEHPRSAGDNKDKASAKKSKGPDPSSEELDI